MKEVFSEVIVPITQFCYLQVSASSVFCYGFYVISPATLITK